MSDLSWQYALIITLVIVVPALFAADWYVNRKKFNRFTRTNEKHLMKYGTRIIGRMEK